MTSCARPIMSVRALLLLLLLLAALLLAPSIAFEPPKKSNKPVEKERDVVGVVSLDSITFSKIVPSNKVNVVVLVTNKRSTGQYGADSMRADFLDFASKGELHGTSDDVLFAMVTVNGAQNKKLSQRIGIDKDFTNPRLFLFLKGASEPIAFPPKYSYNPVFFTRWLSKYTNFYYGISGTIEEFDLLAERFVAAAPSEYAALIAEAEALSEKRLVTPNEKANGALYLKTMRGIQKSGLGFVIAEVKRIEGLLSGPSKEMSDKKKDDMSKKLNVVYQFDRFDPAALAPEL